MQDVDVDTDIAVPDKPPAPTRKKLSWRESSLRQLSKIGQIISFKELSGQFWPIEAEIVYPESFKWEVRWKCETKSSFYIYDVDDF